MKIMSMPMPSGSDLFLDGVEIDQMIEFHNSSQDLCAEATVAPTPGTTTSSYGSDGTSNCSGEDVSKSFPIVLHTIISEVESDCIHWLPCGTRFVIADKDAFSRDILPQYFGGRGIATTKFTSFTRRLKRWNFSRVPSGRDMGAYYHEKFRRGERGLVKTITYPITKAVGRKSPPGSRGKGGSAKFPEFSNARRRASTGSIMPSGWNLKATRPAKLEAASLDSCLDCISPTPIKDSLNATNVRLPMFENDLNNWLNSANFTEDGGSSAINNKISIDPEPVSAASNPFLLPPPAVPYNVTSGRSQAEGGGVAKSMSMRPMMRRHSMTMPPPSAASFFMPMTSTSRNISNQFTASQLLGASSTCNPELPMSTSNTMAYASSNNSSFGLNNNVAPMPMVKQSEPPKPLKVTSSASGDGNLTDPSNMPRGFSFGDLNMVDPFT